MEDVIETNKKEKIKFFKKIKYSITKISKYPDLVKEGIGASIKYYLILIFLFTIVFSIPIALKTVKVYEDGYAYLNEKLPELEYKEGQLTIEQEAEITLSDELLALILRRKCVS